MPVGLEGTLSIDHMVSGKNETVLRHLPASDSQLQPLSDEILE
jgi:hypothetical protein